MRTCHSTILGPSFCFTRAILTTRLYKTTSWRAFGRRLEDHQITRNWILLTEWNSLRLIGCFQRGYHTRKRSLIRCRQVLGLVRLAQFLFCFITHSFHSSSLSQTTLVSDRVSPHVRLLRDKNIFQPALTRRHVLPTHGYRLPLHRTALL
jgi:hypothetical protein